MNGFLDQGRKYFCTLIFCSVLSSLAWADTTHCPEQELQGFSPARLQRIAPAMQRYIDDGRLPGIVAIIARNGEIIYRESFGYQEVESGTPMQNDTIFRIFSMTKPVTIVAALILYEEGLFQMDDPVSKYLPEFSDLKVWVGGEGAEAQFVDAESPVTIKQLMMHTAGFSYGVDDDEVDRLYREVNPFEPGLTLKQVVERIATLPLKHQPGTAWKYGVSTDILGYLVEVISGQPLDQFMSERIFKPLGMVDTGFYVPEEKLSRLAEIYGPGPENQTTVIPPDRVPGVFETPPVFLSGGGGLVSTGADYLRFAQMLLNKGVLNGERLLGPKTVEFMTMNHLPDSMLPINSGAPGGGFGLGVFVVVDVSQTKTIESKGNFGWGGLASTFFWVDPEENLVGLVLTQFIPFGFYPYHDDFRVLTYQALVNDSPPGCK